MNSIKHIRERLGVTQEAMAAGIKVSQANVSNYEHGQRMPPDVAARLIAYAKTLKTSLSYDDIYAPPRQLKSRQPKQSPNC